MFFLFALMFLSFVSAVEINMKDEFNDGETLLAKFSGNFLDKVNDKNVFFYREHVKIPIEFEIMNVENDYYIYALLRNKEAGKYSFSLENVEYYRQGEVVGEAISKNFTILESFADFSINPGFVSTKKDFEIEIQNLKDTEITININSEKITQNESEGKGFFDILLGDLFLSLTGNVIFNIEEKNTITLSPNEIKRFTFELGEVPEPVVEMISLSTENTYYEFPVYITSAVEGEYSSSLNFKPSVLKVSLDSNLIKEERVILENIGDETIENITFEVSNNLEPFVNVSRTNIYNLEVNASEEIFLLFAPNGTRQTIEGELTASIPNETEDLSIIFEILFEDSGFNEIPAVSNKCKDINGTLFEEPKKCLNETRFTSDGNCCLGEVKKPEGSNTGFIIGWAIIMAIIIAVVWFFKFKYKGGKQEVNLFKIAKGKK